MKISGLLKKLPQNYKFESFPRPYINHSVKFKKQFTAQERAQKLEEVGLNVFLLPSEMVTGCDLLSDSGVTTMTDEQWAALHRGDEAYGSNSGYFLLLKQIEQTFGEGYGGKLTDKPTSFIFHQGRPAEHALFGIFGKQGQGQIIPSNGHFDTTQANIEENAITALNFFSPSLKDPSSTDTFKGNIDVRRLEELLKKNKKRVPLIYITITNNTGGGQPVSLHNIKTTARLSRSFDIPLFFDACRFAENAWFIKQHEEGYEDKSIVEIVREMFSHVDGFSISFKKDGLVNMGGGIFLKKNGRFVKRYPRIPDALTNHQIITEGHPTYGGMSGRDIMTLVTGLQTVVQEQYLTYRIHQVQQFGRDMQKRNLPVMTPFGGHAVYLDMNEFFAGTKRRPEDYCGISFTALLLAVYGHRACELGNFAFGKYDPKTKKETYPEVNFVRFAVPRLRYERQDLAHVAESVSQLYQNRDMIPAVNVVYGRDLPLRHFKARFQFADR